MTVGARIGIATIVLVLVAIIGGALYFYMRPLNVLALSNRRLLKQAGLTSMIVIAKDGPQTYWVGGQGQTLVLLHGAGDQAGTWAKVVQPLTSRYRVVVPDLAGHGASAPAEGAISITHILGGLDAVIKQESHGPAILVGNSLGAWVALLYAREHPASVARVVLVNGGALKSDRTDVSLMPQSRAEAAALMTQLRDPSSAPIPTFVLDDVVRAANAGPIARFARTANEMEGYILEGRLHEIAAPVDLLWGESDKVLPVAYARRMMAQLPASRLTPLATCGHVPQVECPERFERALSEILAAAPPARPTPEQTPSPAATPTGDAPGSERK
jgi:pimeloyl-ACP methyl ester carboxylesterase